MDRMRGKNLIKRPDPLMLLAVIVTLCAVMSTTVNAAELIQFQPQSRLAKMTAAFDENGYRVTGLGDSSAGLHVSLTPPPEVREVNRANAVSSRGQRGLSDVYLSIRLPW